MVRVGPRIKPRATSGSRARIGTAHHGRSTALNAEASPLTSLAGGASFRGGAAGPTAPAARPDRDGASRIGGRTKARPARRSRTVIQLIEQVIPSLIWVALGAALLLALINGVVAVRASRRARAQAQRIVTVSAEAVTDPLTGVLNRRGFTAATEREIDRARRYSRPFVLAYVDVRGLKAVNDSAGHLAGDRLLRETAQLLQNSARAHDVVGRIGGDELAVLLVEQSAESAMAVTSRIHDAVPAGRAAVGVGVSWDLTVGTAAYPQDGESFNELLRAADRRLYQQRGIALR